jgi:hypothetical protein
VAPPVSAAAGGAWAAPALALLLPPRPRRRALPLPRPRCRRCPKAQPPAKERQTPACQDRSLSSLLSSPLLEWQDANGSPTPRHHPPRPKLRPYRVARERRSQRQRQRQRQWQLPGPGRQRQGSGGGSGGAAAPAAQPLRDLRSPCNWRHALLRRRRRAHGCARAGSVGRGSTGWVEPGAIAGGQRGGREWRRAHAASAGRAPRCCARWHCPIAGRGTPAPASDAPARMHGVWVARAALSDMCGGTSDLREVVGRGGRVMIVSRHSHTGLGCPKAE